MKRRILYGVNIHLGSLQSITNQHPWEEAHTLNLTNVCDPTLYTGLVHVYVCTRVHVYTQAHAHDHITIHTCVQRPKGKHGCCSSGVVISSVPPIYGLMDKVQEILLLPGKIRWKFFFKVPF